MKQTNAIFEIENGVLMADQDRCTTLKHCRVIVEPMSPTPSTPWRYDQGIVAAPDPKPVESPARRADRIATRFLMYFLLGTAIYLVAEVAHAFSSGVFVKVVGQ